MNAYIPGAELVAAEQWQRLKPEDVALIRRHLRRLMGDDGSAAPDLDISVEGILSRAIFSWPHLAYVIHEGDAVMARVLEASMRRDGPVTRFEVGDTYIERGDREVRILGRTDKTVKVGRFRRYDADPVEQPYRAKLRLDGEHEFISVRRPYWSESYFVHTRLHLDDLRRQATAEEWREFGERADKIAALADAKLAAMGGAS